MKSSDSERNAEPFTFLVDSGASHHAVPHTKFLIDYNPFANPTLVRTATDTIANSLGQGDLLLLIEFAKRKFVLKLKSVQYVPDVHDHIISANAFNVQFGTTITLSTSTGTISSRRLKAKIGLLHVRNRVYRLYAKILSADYVSDLLDGSIYFESWTPKISNIKTMTDNSNRSKDSTITSSCSNSLKHKNNSLHTVQKTDALIAKTTVKRSIKKISPEKLKMLEKEGEIWHERLGHINQSSLNRLKHVAQGIPDFIYKKITENCTTCGLSKLTRKVFNEDRDRASRPCEIIHADLIGEITPPTAYLKNKYIMTLIDDYTRYLQVFTLKSKTEVANCLEIGLRTFQSMFTSSCQFGTFRSDNGTEFVNSEVDRVLEMYKMTRQCAEPNAHEHNGLIERLNRTLEERIRALIISAGFPDKFWGVAVHCAAYLYNRTPHSALNFITPYEKAFDKIPDLSYLRRFGARTYVLNEKLPKGNKIKPRSIITYLVGFTSTGYEVYNPKTRKIMKVCNAKVDETNLYRHDFPNDNIPNILFPKSTPTETEMSYSSDRVISVNNEIQTSSGDLVAGRSSDRALPNSRTPEIQIETEINYDRDNDPPNDDNHTNDESTIETAINYDWDADPRKIFSLNFYTHFDKHIHAIDEIPITYDEAISGRSKHHWLPAIQSELDSIEAHEVWDIVPKTKEMRPVPIK